jgi:hypothetical protein
MLHLQSDEMPAWVDDQVVKSTANATPALEHGAMQDIDCPWSTAAPRALFANDIPRCRMSA